MSTITLLLYAFDKSAARHRRARIPERTLLLLGLAGGWPGAILAQQVFHHKTLKSSFRLAFAATVLLNVALLIAIFYCSEVMLIL